MQNTQSVSTSQHACRRSCRWDLSDRRRMRTPRKTEPATGTMQRIYFGMYKPCLDMTWGQRWKQIHTFLQSMSLCTEHAAGPTAEAAPTLDTFDPKKELGAVLDIGSTLHRLRAWLVCLIAQPGRGLKVMFRTLAAQGLRERSSCQHLAYHACEEGTHPLPNQWAAQPTGVSQPTASLMA